MKLCHMTMTAVVLALAPQVLAASQPHNQDTFVSGVLKGKQAAEFRLPANAQWVKSFPLTTDGMQAKRYQQHFANAIIFGGDISVITDANGRIVSVVGRPYQNLLSSNEVKLRSDVAKGIVVMKIGGMANGKPIFTLTLAMVCFSILLKINVPIAAGFTGLMRKMVKCLMPMMA